MLTSLVPNSIEIKNKRISISFELKWNLFREFLSPSGSPSASLTKWSKIRFLASTYDPNSLINLMSFRNSFQDKDL